MSKRTTAAQLEKHRNDSREYYHKNLEYKAARKIANRKYMREYYHRKPGYKEAKKEYNAGRKDHDKMMKKKRYKENPRKVRSGQLKHLYGISLEMWEAMFAQQGFACGACGTIAPTGKKCWATDHDHDTGQIRKIICSSCNKALGHTKDSIPRLRALISYLEAHGRR